MTMRKRTLGFIILALQSVAGHTTQYLELNITNITDSRRQEPQQQFMPPPQDNNDENLLNPSIRDVGHVNEAVLAAATRFTRPSTTTKKYQRTTPHRVSFKEDCDYLAYYCLKAYDTGVICGRTMYYKYYTFKNYCILDYVNCMERYELWQVVHMGECYIVKELTEYVLYPYDDDFFLDQYYIVEDN